MDSGIALCASADKRRGGRGPPGHQSGAHFLCVAGIPGVLLLPREVVLKGTFSAVSVGLSCCRPGGSYGAQAGPSD